MAETLLGLSEVLIFGRKVEDLQLRKSADADHAATVTTTRHVPGGLSGHKVIDGINVTTNDIVLVRHHSPADNGLYTVAGSGASWTKNLMAKGAIVFVAEGIRYGRSFWIQTDPDPTAQKFRHAGGRGSGQGQNNQLDNQLSDDAGFARIYGFSYEGAYYELPNPTLFLVHGEGESATDGNMPHPPEHGSRAPTNPSVSGVAAADFQFADDIMVWSYDKADYTIRMDVETGMFEQVLLDVMFGGGPGGVAGANVRGANVRGANVRGANVRGANVRGANVRGGGGGD
jgi:hypothetical protein